MTDLRFAFRQLLKNPGFTAVAGFTLENAGRTPGGHRSRTRARNRPADKRRLDDSASHGQTRSADRGAGAPDADRDALDSRGIAEGLPVPLPLPPGPAPGRGARSRLCPGSSRGALEIAVLDFRKRLGVPLELSLEPIDQGGQCRARARVANNPLPGGVSIQFGQQLWQIFRQLAPLLGRKRSDGRCDFLNRAHGGKIPSCPSADKRRVPPRDHD